MRKESRDRYDHECYGDNDDDSNPYPAQQFSERRGQPRGKSYINEEESSRHAIKMLLERQEELVNKNAQLKHELDISKLRNKQLLHENNRLAYQIPPNSSKLSEAPWIVDLPPPLEDVKPNRKSLEMGMCNFCYSRQFIVASAQLPNHDGLVKSCEFCLANFEAYRDVVQ